MWSTIFGVVVILGFVFCVFQFGFKKDIIGWVKSKIK